MALEDVDGICLLFDESYRSLLLNLNFRTLVAII